MASGRLWLKSCAGWQHGPSILLAVWYLLEICGSIDTLVAFQLLRFRCYDKKFSYGTIISLMAPLLPGEFTSTVKLVQVVLQPADQFLKWPLPAQHLLLGLHPSAEGERLGTGYDILSHYSHLDFRIFFPVS